MDEFEKYYSEEIPVTCIKANNILKEFQIFAETYKCPLCENVIFTPVTCSTCFEIAGEQCVQKWQMKNSNCPMSKCETFTKFPKMNPVITKALEKIQVKCEYKDCDKIMNLDQFYDHLSKCINKIYFCKGDKCYFQGKLEAIEEHVNFKCQKLHKVCTICSQTIKVFQFSDHITVCKEIFIYCEYCQENIKEIDYKEHKKQRKQCLKIFEEKIRKDEQEKCKKEYEKKLK